MKYQPIKYKYTDLSKNEIIKRSNDFYKIIKKRRSIRDFDEKSIPNEIIKKANYHLNKPIHLEYFLNFFTFGKRSHYF